MAMIRIDKIFMCLCHILYRHLRQWKIHSLDNLELYLLFCLGYIQQKELHQFLIYRERDF